MVGIGAAAKQGFAAFGGDRLFDVAVPLAAGRATAHMRLQPGRGAVPKLPSAMGNGEPSLNCLLPPLNITDEEALEVVVNETDKLARISHSCLYGKN